ncbi:hypothetical protein [Arthrobacter sp. PAMC 25486]|uniref:hypothetical protein n=1 Tax=Arthrobacter sp. PAMC 25486 TaxID=1494608 RepID=UPI00056EE49E|nr:hypothetical protein [Arthrobacter sp. PAMC 25486]
MSIKEHSITAMAAALEGSHVAFFGATHDDARAAFKAADALAPDGCEIRRTNGNESIRTRAGGSIHFLSIRSKGGRGMALDRVYVPAALADEDVALEIEACLATSQNPMFIGYL